VKSSNIFIVRPESLDALVMVNKHINAILYIPVGLLEEKMVQLELGETHLVKLVESFKFIPLLSIV